jgi:chemotaxis protein MotA
LDIATLSGLLLGVGAIALSYHMEGGHLAAVLQAPAMVLVIFGTIGAATMTTSFKMLVSLPKIMKIAFFAPKLEPVQVIEEIVRLSEKARREGLLSLEKEFKSVKHGFLKKGIEFAIDGIEPSSLRNYLEIEMNYIAERHKAGATFFQKLGGFSPTLGIIGTVLGLVHALGTISDASKMASSIAGAFIATLWGISMANLLFLPISDKLRHRNEEEALVLEIIMEGVSSLASGENPRMIRAKLLGFLRPTAQKEK